jgi:site-specific DNA-methyltransferase (adenine-specific)
MNHNVLYYGDNLDILRRYVKDETVDLVYLDPPFNSNATYNVLFAEQNGTRAAAQIKAFEDTWTWDQEAAREYEETVETGGRVADALRAFWTFLGPSNMLAYLAMMAPRLVELRRVLKPTGSIYLHCDPTASHYLKMLMDAVFGAQSFRNEITWKRFNFHADAKRFGRVSDRLLFYSKGEGFAFRQLKVPFSGEYVASKFTHVDKDGRVYRLSDLNPPSGRGPVYEFHGVTKAWRCTKEKMLQLEREGRIYTGSKVAQLKRYLDELEGQAVNDIWADVVPINPRAAERLGYPTQKPLALLERIISASSNEGDLVLDPFCGCGTAVIAAEKLKRNWIGIDITHLAITLIKNRLLDSFGEESMPSVIGEPVSIPDAEALAAQDPWQFQWWALGLVGARPVEHKKGADRGIDGRLYFHDEAKGKTKQVIISVKAGEAISTAHVRDLAGVLSREQAEIGVLISMKEPTQPMRTEAASAGFYSSPGWHTKHPRLQILTVADLLGGAGIDYPSRHANVTFRRAPRLQRGGDNHAQMELGANEDGVTLAGGDS